MELELTPDDRATLEARAAALLDALQSRRDAGAIYTPTPESLVAQLAQPPVEHPGDPADVFGRLTAATTHGWDKTQGGDLAYIPSSGLQTGALAAGIAAAIHAYTGASYEAPALIALEESVLGWMADVLGLPPTSEGVLLSGGSLANQTALVCAREHMHPDPEHAVAFLTPRVHHSVLKAMRLSGMGSWQTRKMPVDADGRVDAAALRAEIAAARTARLHPWLLIAAAGDTDTGRVDPLDELAATAADTGCWLHVDAAYGGFFALTDRGRARTIGLGRADSITVDPHKSLFLPYGVGAVLVRHPGALAAAHTAEGSYLRDLEREPGLPQYFERGPENTRPFRGLLVWLPLQLHGVAAFRSELDRMLDLAAEAAIRLRALPGIEVPLDPDLSVVVFRATAGDARTEALLDALNASGGLHLSSTTLDGHTVVRLVFLNHRTGPAQLDAVIRVISEVIRR